MTLLLHKLIPEEVILRSFSFLSVVDMRNVVVNHQLLGPSSSRAKTRPAFSTAVGRERGGVADGSDVHTRVQV